jgi:hypothetical protein
VFKLTLRNTGFATTRCKNLFQVAAILAGVLFYPGLLSGAAKITSIKVFFCFLYVQALEKTIPSLLGRVPFYFWAKVCFFAVEFLPIFLNNLLI